MTRSLLPSLLIVALTSSAMAAAQSTTRVSLSTTGTQGNQFSEQPAISGDGRFVAFSTVATNLIANDTNNSDDVLVHDRQTGATTRVSVATGDGQASGPSHLPRLSHDGRYVVFEGWASDLVANDTNGYTDVFVHDRQTVTTTRVSVSSSGVQATGPSYAPTISANGRYVAFHSAAANLVTGDTNNAWDVFVHDRQTGATTRVSLSNTGAQVTGSCSNASISADGRYVAFHSGATTLVAGDTNGSWDVFVRDTVAATTTRVSVDSTGAQANGSSVNASLSADGRKIAFHSAATNLVLGDVNGFEDVFVRDVQAGTTTRVSVRSNGLEANGTSKYASISADGRFVVFESLADNLVLNDLNGDLDVFVRDLASSTTTRASVDSFDIEADGTSSSAAISADGRSIAFQSYGDTLVANDTNNTGDVFVHDAGYMAPAAYCTAGTTSHGCVPSIGSTGTASATATSGFTITVNSVEGQKQGLLFYGVDNTGFIPLPWGTSSSYMCMKAPTQRTLVQSSGGILNACNGSLSVDWNAFMAANPSALGNPLQAGQHIYAQGWFRDPPSPKHTMLSNALEFVVGP